MYGRVGMKSLINVVVVAVVVLAGAAPVAAHNVLRSSTPADGAVLATPPADVRLVFDQSVVTLGTEVAVTGPDGPLALEPPAVDGETVTQSLPAGLPAGDYNVAWRATSADGHPVSGDFTFTAEATEPSAEPTAPPSALPTEPTSDPVTPTSSPTGPLAGEEDEDDGTSGSAVAAVAAVIVVVITGGVAVTRRRRP